RETADAVGILMTAAILIVRDERILFVYLEVAAQTDTVVDIRRDYGLIEKCGLQRYRIENRRVDDRITLGCRAVEVNSKRRALFLEWAGETQKPSTLLVRSATERIRIARVQALIVEVECRRAVILV